MENCYKMGDYCYSLKPTNSECNSDRECICPYKYYITTSNSDSKQEYNCLSQTENCPERFNSYMDRECLYSDLSSFCTGKKKKIEFRSDNSIIYRCSDECLGNEIIFDDNYCVDNCEFLGKKKYYPDSNVLYKLKCLDDCITYNLKELDNECVSTCSSPNSYYDESNNKCVTSCNSGFTDVNGNKCISTSLSNNCYSNVDETTLPKKCYSSCSQIPNNHIYETNKVCSNIECEFHTNDNEIKKCFNSRADCYEAHYQYFRDKICMENCDYFINGEVVGGSIDCFIDQEDCKSKGFLFYTSNPRKCYHTCPTPLHPHFFENDFPKEDSAGSTCSDCSLEYQKLSNGYCKEKCDDNECYFLSQPKICKSINDNFYYIDGENKICLENCESDSKYHFEDSKECLTECKSRMNTNEFIYYDSSKICHETCNDYAEIPMNGHKECKTTISTGFYYEKDGKKIIINDCNNFISSSDPYKCVINCGESEKLDIKNCVATCSNSQRPIFGKTQITVTKEDGNTIQVNINKCIAQCSDLNLEYYIPEEKQCVDSCNTNNYYIVDHYCYKKCEGSNKFINPNTFVCSGNCPDGFNFYRQLSDDYPEIYFCDSDCKNNEYYLNNECLSKCPYNYNKIGKDRKCKSECESEDGLYKKKVETLSNYNIYKCINSCSSENGGDYAIEDTFECVPNCNIQIPESPDNNYHFYKGPSYPVNTCVKECPEDKPYLDTNTCTSSCQGGLPFLDGKICKENCPDGKYYVNIFLEDEEDKQKKCLTDCPIKYPYYVENNNRYLCMHQCNDNLKYFKDYLNPEKIGKKCTDQCPDNNYKFISDDGKECLASCPIGKYYINEINTKCMDGCSEGDYLFHKKNDYECKKMLECEPHFIDYNERLCVDSCSESKYKYEENVNGVTLTVCLNSCSDYGKYLTPDNRCISSCEEDTNLNLEIDESTQFKCKCKYFYYKDLSSLQFICLDNGKTCKDSVSGIYKIQKVDSKECINKCDDILSLNGDYCYKENNQCGENTKVINDSGQKKCDCLYKYYLDDSNKKVCLNSFEKCPSTRPLYVPKTKQCVENCPSNFEKIFIGFCLDLCPKGAEFNSADNECHCPENSNWYSISETNFECLPGDCIESHPFLVHDTKQCIEKCKYTIYPLLVVNECYSNCALFPNTVSDSIDSFANDYRFASSTCRCRSPWYFDENQRKNICPEDGSINSCSDFSGFSFNYIVKTTRQCVVSCPSDYSYSFNDECFNSCENEANAIYNFNVKTNGNSKKCICNNLWKYENNKIICLDGLECESGFLEIFDTRQCYKIQEGNPEICPNESPLILNRICYKINQCPSNSHYDPDISGKCVCDNLWYLTINNKIHCLPKATEICPDSYPYQIFKTNQCIEPENTPTKCPPNSPYVFNYICYENKCQENTKIESDSSQICVCDETNGKWYKYNEYNPNGGKIYLYCALNNCPEIPYKPNLLEEKKECTYNCDEDGETEYICAYRDICYKE